MLRNKAVNKKEIFVFPLDKQWEEKRILYKSENKFPTITLQDKVLRLDYKIQSHWCDYIHIYRLHTHLQLLW